MNISDFNTVAACEKGAWMTIKDFDGIDTDMEFKVIGIDSKAFKSQVNRLSKQNENKKMDMDQLEASQIRTLTAITIDWKNIEKGTGEFDAVGNEIMESIPFTKENAEAIYINSPHISNQIVEFAKERTNFLERKHLD